MDISLLQPEIQQFINENAGADLQQLALKKNPFPQANWIEILNQIAARTKAKNKLPTWFHCPNILYPAKISIEQTSSEKTAEYKSQLISGTALIDLTGGFGVDDFYFAKRFKEVVHCEINSDLSAIVKHNFDILKTSNVRCISGDSEQILLDLKTKFDWIYIDPSRRNDAKGKVFQLKDCLPNVPELLEFYFHYADKILMKTAPILDIAAGFQELKNVSKIHIVALENEVKELLWEIHKGHVGQTAISTVNLTRESPEHFDFILGDPADVRFSLPKKYLYEPNAAMMKSGGFDMISARFQIDKLHPHSHLYTSETPIDFPGRVFEIDKEISYGKSEMKGLLNAKANVTVRNFPDSVETIRKKWKIKDGGSDYCFFTTDANNRKIVLICTKIK